VPAWGLVPRAYSAVQCLSLCTLRVLRACQHIYMIINDYMSSCSLLKIVHNVFLRGPGLHFYVTGKRKTTEFEAGTERKITNPAGLKMVFTLLCKPDLLNATYRDIAAAARVALGTVGPVMRELETRGHIAPLQQGAPK
jgi:hypothetical protein